MLILGLNGGADSVFDSSFGLSKNAYHDTASVLIQDGSVIVGIEEERLNRIKHTNKAWVLSVRFCLEEANKSLTDIDYIVVYFNQDVLNRILKQEQLNNPLLIEIGNPHKLFEHLFFVSLSFA
ncbi:carbamoyltransferase N-terminal domain-containing protein [Methylomonas fluvii]|uniref:carbamoyltransferase N-terminal domain-containing protein n=1 Tax=Methylomonas fluvii TaxID=1854564 RepID=UPI001A033736|nr:carbamoyltransferase N-terminal domain-containing protein [Methylomonas fluvii]CAD6874518.1 hypothetical protein [Methylomonas fluvii]